MEDHYRTLAIPRGASPEQIQEAYERLARKYAPEHNASPLAHGLFRLVHDSYLVLRCPEQREAHDRELAEAHTDTPPVRKPTVLESLAEAEEYPERERLAVVSATALVAVVAIVCAFEAARTTPSGTPAHTATATQVAVHTAER